MADETPEPITPTLATAISALRSLGTVVGAIGAIWGFVRTEDLTGLYQWVHTSGAASAGAAALFVICFGWGLWRKYVDRTVVTAGHAVGVTKENAAAIVAGATTAVSPPFPGGQVAEPPPETSSPLAPGEPKPIAPGATSHL